MSYLKKCDFCGKLETQKGVKFDNNPICLKVKSPYNKKSFNVSLNVLIEDSHDVAEMQNLKNNTDFINDLLSGTIQTLDRYMTINSPNIFICNNCKMELIKLTKDYGKIGKFIEF